MHTQKENNSTKASEDIFPAEAWELISKNSGSNKPIIIDVSTPKEYEDLHLEGAINVSILSWFFKTRLDAMGRNKTYIVYCKVGVRSKVAKKIMESLGFQNIYNIVGGTLLWEEEGLPFAAGTSGINKLTLCPFYIFILVSKKVKNIFTAVYT
jgi:rhodanese-related sulfurtransferase